VGAIKPNDYSEFQKAIALGARALNHPCRVKIFSLLQIHGKLNAEELHKLLKLSRNCVRDHVAKLIDVGVVNLNYEQHCYVLSINYKRYIQFCLNLDSLPERIS